MLVVLAVSVIIMRLIPVVLLLFLLSCAPQAPVVEGDGSPSVDETAREAVDKTVPEVQDAPGIDLTEAFMKGTPIKCTTKVGEQTSTLYIKEEKIRMDTMPADAHGIYTKEMMYTWTRDKGAMMNLAEVEQIAGRMGDEYEPQRPADVVAKAEQSNAECEPATVSDELFSPPADVQFQDMTEILRQLEGVVGDMR